MCPVRNVTYVSGRSLNVPHARRTQAERSSTQPGNVRRLRPTGGLVHTAVHTPDPRIASLSILLQQRIQLARHTVQLLWTAKDMRLQHSLLPFHFWYTHIDATYYGLLVTR